jgi:mannosyl-oligosaccharide alpha-1,2-mannosidase
VTLSRNDEEFEWNDSMESFWFSGMKSLLIIVPLADNKHRNTQIFLLLFSTPDTVSLDDYVLNTEAHPFKRLDFGRKRLA